MHTIAEKVDTCQVTQNILRAAEAHSVLEAALNYQRLGYAIVPISNGQKHPDIKGWQNLGRLTEDEIRDYYATGKYWGVGLRPGVLSNGLVAIDCDSPEAYAYFCQRFPHLAETYTERTRKGMHIFLQVDHIPVLKTGKITYKHPTGNIEVFYNTGQIVVSPSPHVKGGHYTPYKRVDVLRVKNIDSVIRWALDQERRPQIVIAAKQKTQTVASYDEVWAAVERAAGIAHYDADGWSAYVPCPFTHHEHDDTDPKFGLNENGFGHCHKCERTANTKQLAEAYGIEWPKAEHNQLCTLGETNIASENQFSNAPTILPDSWLFACWEFAPPGIAPVLHLLYAAGLTDKPFTVKDLLEPNLALGYGISERSLYSAVEKLAECQFLQKLETIESASVLISNSCKNTSAGRGRDIYCLCSKAEIIAQFQRLASPRLYEKYNPVDSALSGDSVLAHVTPGMMEAIGVEGAIAGELDHFFEPAYSAQGNKQEKALRRAYAHRKRLISDLHNEHSTPLSTNWPKNNDANLKAAHLRGYVEANPGATLSRRQISERYGVSNGSIEALRRRAGLAAERQAPLTIPVQSAAELDSQVRQYGRIYKAKALKVISRKTDGSATEWYYQKNTAPQLVASELEAGHTVNVEFSLPSKHRIASAEPPVKPERKPREAPKARESRPPAPALAHGENKRFCGAGYNPRWVGAQMKLALKLLGWLWDGRRLINPETGEYAPDSAFEIVEMLLGRELPPDEEAWGGFLADAAEFGAVTNMRPRTQRPPGEGWVEVPVRKIA